MTKSLRLIGLALLFVGPADAQWTPQGGLLIRGKLVTMDGEDHITDGALLVRNGKIEQVLPAGAALPAGAIEVDSGGVVFPGLINLHGHTAYDFLPLFPVPKHYDNREQWASGKAYEELINNPKTLVTGTDYFDLQTEALKYAELKAIVGGETAVQGTPADSGVSTILARNVEAKNFGQDKVGQRGLSIDGLFVADLAHNQAAIGKLDAWLFHLGEGIGPGTWASNEFANASYDRSRPPGPHNQAGLKNLSLVGRNLVGIHCTGLVEDDFKEWKATAGEPAKIVWSPLSNLLLYGQTTDILAAQRQGAVIALGTDWSPSGSKNLLWELKVAEQVSAQKMAGALSPRDLVAMVTRNPARIVHWDDKLGRLAPGMVGDVVVMDAQGADPYRALLDGTETNVQLVLIDGAPVYGDETWLARLQPAREPVPGAPGRAKAVVLKANVPNGNESLAQIIEKLNQALKLDPQDLADVLNRGNGGPPSEATQPRQRLKKWLADQLTKKNQPVPPALRDPSAPVTAEQVRQFLIMKFPNAVPGVPELDTIFEENDGNYFRALEANVHFASTPPVLDLGPITGHGVFAPERERLDTDVSDDWLLVKLAPNLQTCSGELADGVAAPLAVPAEPLEDAITRAVRSARVGIAVSRIGVRLDHPTSSQIRRAARMLEHQVGPVGIVKVSTNECWGRGGFDHAFPPR